MRTVTVKGTGRGSFPPDRIEIGFTVASIDPVYEKASEELNKRLAALTDALGSAGFHKDDLKTSSFNVGTEYRSERAPDGSYRQVFAGYRFTVRQTLCFAMDLDRLSGALDAVSGSLAEPELNVSFTLSDRRKALDVLLADAVRNAGDQARALAQAAGVKLGRLLSIDAAPGRHAFVSETHYERSVRNMKVSALGAPAFAPEDVREEEEVLCVWEIDTEE